MARKIKTDETDRAATAWRTALDCKSCEDGMESDGGVICRKGFNPGGCTNPRSDTTAIIVENPQEFTRLGQCEGIDGTFDPIAVVRSDGTVEIHKHGELPEAARTFWAHIAREGGQVYVRIAELEAKLTAALEDSAYARMEADELRHKLDTARIEGARDALRWAQFEMRSGGDSITREAADAAGDKMFARWRAEKEGEIMEIEVKTRV